MNEITLKAPAKINLTLDIKGKRADGYHEIETIMQSVSLCDTVTIKKSDGISVACSLKELCGNENLAYRAAELFFKKTKINGGAEIYIEKSIPKAAGLAGGSTDAAAVLRGLNTLYTASLTQKDLCEIALSLGADVPFCVVGKTSLCKGIGEILTPVASLCDCYIVIVKKGDKLSTGALYSNFDKDKTNIRPNTAVVLKALEQKNLLNTANNLCNVFECVQKKCLPTKAKMLEFGALGASLSGSGPSVFALFDDENKAKLCAEYFNKSSFICKPL